MEKEKIKNYRYESLGASIIFAVAVIFSLLLINSLIDNNYNQIENLYSSDFLTGIRLI